MIRHPRPVTTVIQTIPGEPAEAALPISVTAPAGSEQPKPGIVLFPEIFGVNDFILETAKALAENGYVVAVPDLYWRADVPRPLAYDDLRSAMKLALTIEPESSAFAADAAIATLVGRADVDRDRLGVMGFCVGGLLSCVTASRYGASIKACVVYYASGLTGRSPHPKWPDDLLLTLPPIAAPVRAFFGSQDDHIPASYVSALDRTLEAQGAQVETNVYDGAGHGFANAHLGAYQARAAQDAWAKTISFFAGNLGSPAA